MFGYVHPAAQVLTQKDQALYQATYCGLCHALGKRYGLAGRMILNYDLTFLAMLLEKGTCPSCEMRCIAHPVKKRCCVCGSDTLDTVADLSVILVRWQLQDAVDDRGFFASVPYRLAKLALALAYGKARRRQAAFDETTRLRLQELRALEQAKCASLDQPADTFARLLQSASSVEEDSTRRRVLEQILYHLGRWIYLVDALDDLKKDVASGNYNPIPLRYAMQGDMLEDADKNAFAGTLDCSVRTMAAAFELADFGAYHDLIENVVYQGLYQVSGAVLNGTYRKMKRKK